MLSLHNVLATEPSHRLSNLQRSFLCYHTSTLMLLLVFFLGPLKKKRVPQPEISSSHFSRPYSSFIYYSFSLQKNMLLGVFFCLFLLLSFLATTDISKQDNKNNNISFSCQKQLFNLPELIKMGVFFFSLTWLGHNDFIYNHTFQHLCRQCIFLHFYSLQEFFKKSHSNDIIISLYFKSSISIITYLRTNQLLYNKWELKFKMQEFQMSISANQMRAPLLRSTLHAEEKVWLMH